MNSYKIPTGTPTRHNEALTKLIDSTVVRPGLHHFYLGENRFITIIRGRLWAAMKRDGNCTIKTQWEPKTRCLKVRVER